MDKAGDLKFLAHTIVGIEDPDGSRSAQEMFVHRTVKGKLKITPIEGTKRTLPLTREAAEDWIFRVLGDLPQDERQSMINMLCCEEDNFNNS
jgi:hypothetical protein